MKNRKIKIYAFLLIALMAIEAKTQAQEIKFPESFRFDKSQLKEKAYADIPQEVQTKYGILKNPGLITEPSKAKGFLMSGKLRNVQSVYFEIYKDLDGEKMTCCFEVAKFVSVSEMEKILPKTDKQSESVILLTLKNYLIIVYGPPSKNVCERLDDMSKYFQKKLGAKLFQDRRKEVETSVVDDYVSNLPPPLPPEPIGNYTSITIEDLDKRIYTNTAGLAYMRDKKLEKLASGNYRAFSTYPVFESLVFTINKDGLLDGDYIYHYAEDYSKSPSKESKLTFDNGVKVSEIIYEKGKLIGSKVYSSTITKQGKDYLIIINALIKSPAYGVKEVVTVFRNRKPISKITTRAGESVVRKDFEKNYLEEFNNKGQLTKLQKPGLIEEYNNTGEVTYKEEWVNDNQFIYKYGKLRHKEIRVKGKDQYLVTEYDSNGNVIKEWVKGIENYTIVDNPDEYENDLTETMFEYYKNKAR